MPFVKHGRNPLGSRGLQLRLLSGVSFSPSRSLASLQPRPSQSISQLPSFSISRVLLGMPTLHPFHPYYGR